MSLFKKKTIYGCEARGDQNLPYLTRWEFLSSRYFAIYLHRFHRSDDNSSLHDHPWNFITIPLKKGYNDCQFNGGRDINGKPTFIRTLMKPFHIYYRKATHVHFVELLTDYAGLEIEAWTLVIRFKYIRWWGFWNNGIFTVFMDYFQKNRC